MFLFCRSRDFCGLASFFNGDAILSTICKCDLQTLTLRSRIRFSRVRIRLLSLLCMDIVFKRSIREKYNSENSSFSASTIKKYGEARQRKSHLKISSFFFVKSCNKLFIKPVRYRITRLLRMSLAGVRFQAFQ